MEYSLSDILSTPSPSPSLPKLLLALSSLLLLGYLTWHFLTYGNNGAGPTIYPFVGTLPDILHYYPNLYDRATELLERCPSMTYTSVMPGVKEVVTGNPENLQHILKTNFANYPKGPSFQENFRDLLGHGIFNSDGEVWRQQRKTASLEFSTNSLRSLMLTAVQQEVADRLLPTLDQAAESGQPVDLQDVLLRYTFDNICRIGFGVDPGCLGPDFPDVPFAKAFDMATKATMQRNIMPETLWRTMKAWGWGLEKDLQGAIQAIDEFTEQVIRKRRKELARKAKYAWNGTDSAIGKGASEGASRIGATSKSGETAATEDATKSGGAQLNKTEPSRGPTANGDASRFEGQTAHGTTRKTGGPKANGGAGKSEGLPQKEGDGQTNGPSPGYIANGISEGSKGELEHSDILSRMIALDEADKGQLYTDRFLRDACTNFILAGRDTSSVALSWLFWLLTWHPEVEEKIVAEVEAVVKARGPGNQGRPFSYEELKGMTYTHAAINESLRLYPSVPADSKHVMDEDVLPDGTHVKNGWRVMYVVKDDVLPDGTRVKKGWRVMYAIYAVGRMTRVWGEDAAEFKPERWIAGDGSVRVESPAKFPAFNAGPRLCLGRDMAYLQMKSVTANVLRRYTLRLVPGHKVAYALSLTLFMRHGLLMHVLPREGD